MRPFWVPLVIALATSASSAQEGRALQSCTLLDLADAATLTGPGVEFLSGRERAGQGGTRTVICFFGVGDGRSLTAKTAPLIVKNAAEYQKMFEPLRKSVGAALEPGLGEYAYSTLDASVAELTVVKGSSEISLELKGKGLGATDLEKMRAVSRKVLGRL